MHNLRKVIQHRKSYIYININRVQSRDKGHIVFFQAINMNLLGVKQIHRELYGPIRTLQDPENKNHQLWSLSNKPNHLF